MSDAKAPLIGDALAAQALCEMAHRRGLHASIREAQQAWQDVQAPGADQRLAAAWQCSAQWRKDGKRPRVATCSKVTV